MVTVSGKSIYRSSRDLGIKSSTAKAIVHRYRSQGTMFIKKDEKQPLQLIDSNFQANDYNPEERIHNIGTLN